MARDGHGLTVVGDKMIVFGGDRNKLSLNDLFELDLRLLLNCIK